MAPIVVSSAPMDVESYSMQRKQNAEKAVVRKDDADESWRMNLRGDEEWLCQPRPDMWWTGPKPVAGAPGMCEDGTITSLPHPDLSDFTRQSVLKYFDNTWLLTEVLFSGLKGEEPFYRPPYHSLRHPLVFYYCHPAALYVNKLRVAGVLDAPVNSYFETIFETGVDEMSWDDLSKNEMQWPSLREAHAYRQQVYALVKNVILSHPCLDKQKVSWDDPAWALFMGFEHERIHLETSSVLYRELPLRLVGKPLQWPKYGSQMTNSSDFPDQVTPKNPLLTVPAGDVTLGKPRDWASYGWDNEYGSREFHVREFSASQNLISNAEFYQFVKAGGYSNADVWTPEGWSWRCFRNVKWPTFWVSTGPAGLHQYKLRLIFEEVPLDPSLPAVVNHHEAKAYCIWRSKLEGLEGHTAYRLLSEPEHHRIRVRDRPPKIVQEDAIMTFSGEGLRPYINFNFAHGSETPVDKYPANLKGFCDVFGNVWQWCEDFFAALPGFKCHTHYDDFSTPCFDGQHNIILGGSFASTGDEASEFARFHFRPHFFQHAGFRLAKGTGPIVTSCMDSPPPHAAGWDPSTTNKTSSKYERKEYLGQHMQVHYDPDHAFDGPVGDFLKLHGMGALQQAYGYPQRQAELLTKHAKESGLPCLKALDIGCSVGGASFKLAENFQSVVGIDLSSSFIQTAQKLKEGSSISYYQKKEGELGREHAVQMELPFDILNRVDFKQMDACCLSPDFVEFDAVLISNVLDRLPSPKSALGRMGGPKGILKIGGLLMVASPYSWNSQFTPPELWLGGCCDADGKELNSVDGLKKAIGPDFVLVSESEQPLIIRDHDRKFSLILSHTTIWRRIK